MNPARPPAGIALCPLEALNETGARGFVFREGDARFAGFVVARSGGAVAGYVDRCPHAGLPLSWREHDYLTRERDLILCASHGAVFRPEDGLCLAGPCAGRALTAWPVRVEDGVVVTG